MRIGRRAFMGSLLAAGGLLVAAEVFAAAPPTYTLSRFPRFGVGDQLTFAVNGVTEIQVTGLLGQRLRDERVTRQMQGRQTVLAVGAAGEPTQFTLTVLSAKETVSSTAPKASAFQKAVTLGTISGRATRVFAAAGYQVDPATLIAAKPPRLSASEIALLKKVLLQPISLRGAGALERTLMPNGPVAVGQTWQPTGAAVAAWAAGHPLTRRFQPRPVRASFTLQSVTGNSAQVAGTIRLRGRFAGRDAEFQVQLSATVDLAGGRWPAQTLQFAMTTSLPDGHRMAYRGTMRSAGAYAAGSGTPPPVPTGHRLPWQPIGRDDSSFRDVTRGVSVDVPKEYRPAMPPPGDMIARFTGPLNAQVSVSLRGMPSPVDMADVLPALKKTLAKNIRDFTLTKSTPRLLPGLVPAMLLEGTGLGGKVAVIRLIAIDDRRVVTLDALAPADRTLLVRQLHTIASSLRLFEPQPPRPKPKPKRPGG